MASINELIPGDYVKVVGSTVPHKIVSVYGVDHNGHLARPSEGGFGVRTEDGLTVSMWDAGSYHKASEVENK